MKCLQPYIAGVVFIFCFHYSAFSTPGLPIKDSIPAKISQLRITVKDLSDGQPLDSVLVAAGAKRGYTNEQGLVLLDSVPKDLLVYASRKGYLLQSRRAKANLTIRLAKRETATAGQLKNGLYERPLEHFSGAATTVSGAELRKLHSLSFIDALKYYDPSLVVNRSSDDPNVVPSVNIRGAYNFPAAATIASHAGTANTGLQLNPSAGDFIASNIANPNQPVFLLNGIQVALQTALDIDINRIEKITILKDAAATSQYGVRGGTGVVLIETKLPQRGSLSVTYSGQLQVTAPDFSSYRLMNAQDKLALEQAAGFYAGNDALYQKRLANVNKGLNTDWISIPTRKGVGTRHYLSLDGGDDDITYGLDFSFNDGQGAMKGSKRQNINVGGYLSTRIGNAVISNYLTFTKSKASNSPYGSLRDYAAQNAFWDPYDSVNGGYKKILDQYTLQGKDLVFYNPAYNGTLSTTNTNDYSRVSNLLAANLNLGSGFRLTGRLNISSQSDEQNMFLPPSHTVFADYTPDEFFKRGQYDQISSEFISFEGALNLHYSKKIRLHQLHASAGVSAQETKSESAGVQLIGFTSDKLSDLAFGSAYSTTSPATGLIRTRLASGYGNVTYSYDNRYQLEVTASADRSSQFGQDNSVAAYWAVGGSWNLHQERFFHQNNVLNELRLHGSIGTAGNLFYQSYLGKTNYNYYTDRQYIQGAGGTGNRGVGLGAFLTGFANPGLTAPETQKQNIGLNAVLLKNRLFVSVDVYRNKTNGIVLPVASPSSTGFLNFNYYDNLGAVQNKGYEFDLAYVVLRKEAVTWSVRFNGLHNENEILATSSYLDELNKASGDQTRPQPKYVVGQSLTGIWAVRSAGIDPTTGNEVFIKTDGSSTQTWNAGDRILAGDISPKLQGSFGTSVTVKNISAGVYFNYQLGAEMYNQTLADKIENASLAYNVDERAAHNRWTKPGDKALYKAVSVNGMLTSPTYATTRFIEKDDVLNCAAIALNYTLPQNISAKMKAKQVKLGFIGNNLFRSASSAERGINYPYSRLYSFSVTASF